MTDLVDRAQGCLLGALIGDANWRNAGVAWPLTDSCRVGPGGRAFGVAPGQITDGAELTLVLVRVPGQPPAQPQPRRAVPLAHPASGLTPTHQRRPEPPPTELPAGQHGLYGDHPSPVSEGQPAADAPTLAALLASGS